MTTDIHGGTDWPSEKYLRKFSVPAPLFRARLPGGRAPLNHAPSSRRAE